jgi:hypothetical protein
VAMRHPHFCERGAWRCLKKPCPTPACPS